MQYPNYQTRTENVLTATPPGVRDAFMHLSSPAPYGTCVGETRFVAAKSDFDRFACSIEHPVTNDEMIAKLLGALGVPVTEETRANLDTAIEFLADKCGHDLSHILTYLRAINLEREVKEIEIPQGRVLLGVESTSANRKAEMEYEFFAKPGSTLRSEGAGPVKFIVKSPTNALLTSPSDSAPVSGGSRDAVQFIIPAGEASTNLYVALLQSGRTAAGQKTPKGPRGQNRR